MGPEGLRYSASKEATRTALDASLSSTASSSSLSTTSTTGSFQSGSPSKHVKRFLVVVFGMCVAVANIYAEHGRISAYLYDDKTTKVSTNNIGGPSNRKISSPTNNIGGPSNRKTISSPTGLLTLPPAPAGERLQALRQQLAAQWISYQDTSLEQQTYFQEFFECGLQFHHLKLQDNLTSTTFAYTDPVDGGAPRVLQSFLACGGEKDGDHSCIFTQDKVREVVSKSDNLLFVGDSVLREQYLLLLCMLDPRGVSPKKFTFFQDDYRKLRYDFNYTQPNATTTTTTTTIRFEGFGREWDINESQLWEDSFPEAVASFASNDAIVLDASRHFTSVYIDHYVKVLEFIRTKALQSKAKLYYMEPTPEEWPTSNGFYQDGCYFKCACQPLTEQQLLGRDAPRLNGTTDGIPLATALDGRTKINRLRASYPSYARLLGNATAARFTLKTNESDLGCFPDCAPATWRVDLVRSMLALDTTTTTTNSVELVPTFWQLVGRSQHSSVFWKGDCTHRSIDAVVFMNEQLLRSMMRRG